MEKILTLKTINQNMIKSVNKDAQALVARAEELQKLLKQGAELPFTEVIRADLVDRQALGQPPFTFLRQVMALCICPPLMEDCDFPDDVIRRVQDILQHCKGSSIGSYSESMGNEIIRKHVAEYFERRDNVASDFKNILLTTGSSEAIRKVLSLLNCPNGTKPAGIMVPVPGHPLYSATIAEYGMVSIRYNLFEDCTINKPQKWNLYVSELNRALKESQAVCIPKAVLVINPGNPTGVILSREEMEEVIKFVHSKKLLLLADEVHQTFSSDTDAQFQSFKRVMTEMGSPYKDMQLISFMSASNGHFAECGPRGGCIELVNIDSEIIGMLFKTMASNSSSSLGQVALDCVVKPPQPGDDSYECYNEERIIYNSAIQDCKMKTHLNSMWRVKCCSTQTFFMFPRIYLPAYAIVKAKCFGQEPDYFYATQLLEETGICVLPGSVFGQSPDSYHFRISKLPDSDQQKRMYRKLRDFHSEFMKKYCDEQLFVAKRTGTLSLEEVQGIDWSLVTIT